ncbi:MAG: hypothetical protein OXF11_03525 [Deltaproteobacteria bacterium]|nr:hypothetical protein [Deltaproteobacteria bacterium]
MDHSHWPFRPDYPTSTAQWSLVIHRVGATSAEVWVGTLFPALKMPERARVRLFRDGRAERSALISRDDWSRPFRGMRRRFFRVVTFRRLEAGSEYRVAFERLVEGNAAAGPVRGWQELRAGAFRTLPPRLPLKGESPFTIGLGSCFYNHRDGGQAAVAYRALYEHGAGTVRPDITALTGDQVYLDIGFDSLSLIPREIRERIADDYALHWQALDGILGRGGTWMLPDDHEYWNDYPFVDSPLPALWSLRLPHVRECWEAASRDAVTNIQRSPVVETVAIGDDVTLCFADLRSHRTEEAFLPAAPFRKLLDWARRRTCPAVLVLPQPLLVRQNRVERNLRSYSKQYAALLDALGAVAHDIVVLSGDVHFGRVASVPIGTAGTRLFEIISSPLSNLTGLNGVAASTATSRPERFPPAATARELDWPARKVNYYKDRAGRGRFFVPIRKGRLLSDYPRKRTREHFMTVSLCRTEGGGIELTANAWLVREPTGNEGQPAKGFRRPFRAVLQ